MTTRIDRTLDVECYHNYFLARFEDIAPPHTVRKFILTPVSPPLDRQSLVNVLNESRIFTFNGINYDEPIVTLAANGADNATLKAASDAIITRNLKWWEFYQKFGIERFKFVDQVDIMEVLPGVRIGLKTYMARCHAPSIQDLPYDPASWLTEEEQQNTDLYCGNDHVGTRMLANIAEDRIKLRESLGQRYGVDVRSKSDAQIAEAVLKKEWARMMARDNGGDPKDYKAIPDYRPHNHRFYYEPPEFIEFVTPTMQDLLENIKRQEFIITDKEEAYILYGEADGIKTGVQMPAYLKNRIIRIGGSCYSMGIGGLHSQESRISHRTDEYHVIKDFDVTSYYPSLIRLMKVSPKAFGQYFQIIYCALIDERVDAKPLLEEMEKLGLPIATLKTLIDGLKIILNGTFGKLLSKYSTIYAPEGGIKVTLTGQLSLLMLIERFELAGVQVVSANTDGVVTKCKRGMEWVRDDIVAWWERKTGLSMEGNIYKLLASRDVNNYVAITDKGKIKRKGVFTPVGVLENKHPDKEICMEAVVAYLVNGTPPEVTIKSCADIRKFIVAKAVTGGAVYCNSHSYQAELERLKKEFDKAKRKHNPMSAEYAQAELALEAHRKVINNFPYLGKTCRWYYGNTKNYMISIKSGNMVASSTGAIPIMQLPETFPTDIDYQHYIDHAEMLLEDIGLGIQF